MYIKTIVAYASVKKNRNMMYRLKDKAFIAILLFGITSNITACPGVEIVSRGGWEARSSNRVISIPRPVKHVIFHHTVTPQCHSKSACSARMRQMQDYHKSLDWGDIGYNFVIGFNGTIYEGVGWNREGVHTRGWNGKSYGIAFIGNYMSVKPDNSMLNAARKLIVCGIKKGFIAKDRWLHGGRDATCTKSPGDLLYSILKQWPRFKAGPLSGYVCP